MKFIYCSLVILLCAYQSLAIPMDGVVANDKIHTPVNEVVDNFRERINYWFARYQDFYDRSNGAMRNYRILHVDLVTTVYNEMVTVFGEDIGLIRHVADDFRAAVESAGDNACVQGIVDQQAELSTDIGWTINGCAIYANQTLSTRLLNMFYPAFMDVQRAMSTVPVAVVDALARGNAFVDELEIISYLEGNYRAKDFQWMTAVSQLLRWETNRFQVDGFFLVDEMRICLADQVLNYVTRVTALQQELLAC
jgi:hypothetical protein